MFSDKGAKQAYYGSKRKISLGIDLDSYVTSRWG